MRPRACLLNVRGWVREGGPMLRTGEISEDLWAVIEPVLPSGEGQRGRPWNDHRQTLEGIIWRFRTGSPWRDVPAEFGPWHTVWERHHRWSGDGTYARMFAAVQEAYSDEEAETEDLAALISIDSTSVRAHQHAAGAPAVAGEEDDEERADGRSGGHTGGWVKLHEFPGMAALRAC